MCYLFSISRHTSKLVVLQRLGARAQPARRHRLILRLDERARKQLWGVLVKSKNETMTSRWLRSCDAATAFAEDGTLDHDEL